MIVAGFAHRYEPDWLIDQLRENLAWVDGFATYDGRASTELWESDKIRVPRLHTQALEMGADWFLYCAPDERFEVSAEQVIRDAIADPVTRSYQFPLREMWSPTTYRVDGIWGRKLRLRLYRLPRSRRHPVAQLPVNIYHLKMIEPANREERKRVFKEVRYYQNKTVGYDYLTDETGLTTEEIPPGRGYVPEYQTYLFQPC